MSNPIPNKLYDSELKIMEVLWKNGDTKAKQIADILLKEVGWNINKVYDGSADKLFSALLGRKKLSAEQLEKLKEIVGELE